jgi:uncharacterized protein (DUF2147 family)
MKRILFLPFMLLICGCMFGQSQFLGEWVTIDDATNEQKSVVNIYKDTNGKYYGKIVRLFENPDAICVECEGADHNQPIVGLVIIRDMQFKDGELRSGRVLDPDNGKLYYAKIYLKDGKLILRGSLDKAGILGRSQTWIRK